MASLHQYCAFREEMIEKLGGIWVACIIPFQSQDSDARMSLGKDLKVSTPTSVTTRESDSCAMYFPASNKRTFNSSGSQFHCKTTTDAEKRPPPTLHVKNSKGRWLSSRPFSCFRLQSIGRAR